jgi:hypothetical protein
MTLLALVAAAAAGGARADQIEDPRPRQALTACASGDVARGVAILAELYAETHNPSFVFNQGRCYQQNGQLEPAAQRFREYLRVGKNEPAGDQLRAEGYIKEAEEGLARGRGRPPAKPAAAAPTAVSAPRPEPGAEPAIGLVELPPPAPDHRRALRVAGIALGAGGVVALAAGGFLSWRVMDKEKQVEARFRGDPGVVEGRALSRQLTAGGRLEIWQYVCYGLGAASLAGAATTVVLAGWPWQSDRASVSVTPVLASRSLGAQVRMGF